MNPTVLIHSLVRQSMVLVAALATTAGQRAQLAQIADQVFADLVRELKEQGLGNKIIADMFGMALRTYHTRVARVAGSQTLQGESLWEAVLADVTNRGPLLRAEILAAFDKDDESVVRGVLRDLVASGLVYRTGRGDATTYRAADATERDPAGGEWGLAALLRVTIYQRGPIGRAELAELVPVDDDVAFDAALERLVDEGIAARTGEGEDARYACGRLVIPFGDSIGWEAAIFDHYQAMVTALVTKLRLGKRRADLADRVGGSTFAFDVWQGHPRAEEALGLLRSFREQAMRLRSEVEEHNRTHRRPRETPWVRVMTYVGQTVKDDEILDEW